MSNTGKTGKIIWARWTLHDDGSLEVVATYGEAGGYVLRTIGFDSLDVAADVLGDSFREVVSRVVAEGLKAGRWRP